MSNNYIVATESDAYPNIRNIISLPFEKTEVVILNRQQNYMHFFGRRKIARLLGTKYSDRIRNLYYCKGGIKFDLLHFFNTINVGKEPWISTFEYGLPIAGNDSNFYGIPHLRSRDTLGIGYATKRLAAKNCKRLIAISKFAKTMNENAHLARFAKYRPQIMDKVSVLHPAQRCQISCYEDKDLCDENIIFTMVGNLFYCKGGYEVLKCFDYLLKSSYPIKLNIISAMGKEQHNLSGLTSDKVEMSNKIIKKHHTSIKHYRKIPNEKVLRILVNSHVGLMPTYYDTYGYFVLEAQACGCPIITTDIMALPEINNAEVGWLIDIPKGEFEHAALGSTKSIEGISNIMVEQLINTISSIADNRSCLINKGRLALERIKNEHNPRDYVRVLEGYYKEAING